MQQLSKVKPKKLYVTVDGPRKTKPKEAELVDEVKKIVQKVDWECDTHFRLLEENVGAEKNISSAIKWVLEENECVIVNEDDIYAGYSFYKFIQDMLYLYKDDKRIGLVSGLNLKSFKSPDRDYYFSHFGHIWGWGTWKRVWDGFDLEGTIEDSVISEDSLAQCTVSKSQCQRVHNIMKSKQNEGIGNVTWDYMFWYYRIKYNYLGIVPSHNLVTNIGVEGLHAKGLNLTHFIKYDDDFQTNQQREVVWDKDYDSYGLTNSHLKQFVDKAFERVRLMYIRRFKINQRFLDDFFNY